MKSKNNLIITGTVLPSNQVLNSTSTRFTLVHNFGGNKKALFLHCVSRVPVTLDKGDRVCISAYLRPCNAGVEAVVKSISKTFNA